jgi:hypothetical protein
VNGIDYLLDADRLESSTAEVNEATHQGKAGDSLICHANGHGSYATARSLRGPEG